MLIKLLIWILVFYFGGRALIRWAASGGKARAEDSSVKGEAKQRVMPYNPDDIVDAHFHDSKSSDKGDGPDADAKGEA